jgi:6-phosphogluconolactonase (cycloisomerase 2 family)
MIESRDGKHVYVACEESQLVHVYRRHEFSSSFTFVQTITAADVSTSEFEAFSFAISADDQFLILVMASALSGHSGLISFFRDPVTGRLTEVAALTDGVNGALFGHSVHAVLSSDQKHIYVSNRGGGVSIVNFDAITGDLTWNSTATARSFVKRSEGVVGRLLGRPTIPSDLLTGSLCR